MKHSFKKEVFFVLAFVMVMLVLTPCVFADVIVEPSGNSFYSTHQCEYHGRSYTVTADAGISAYSEPGAKNAQATYPKGSSLWIDYIYTDESGAVWGISVRGLEGDSGWMKLSDMTLVYDYISFAEEHKNEIVDFDASKYTVPTEGIKLWKYPDSGIVVFDVGQAENLVVTNTYTAPDGRVWGFVSYYIGNRNTWICLDNKGSDPEIVAQTYPLPLTDFELHAVDEADNKWIIPVVVVAVLAATAGVIICVFIDKNKRAKDGNNK